MSTRSTESIGAPAITVRRSTDRGHARHGWLDSRHTFSFGEYHDGAHMGFGPLRVINEDIVSPQKGFGMHPHRDMEIISYVLSGRLRHGDSLGNSGVIRPGEVQRISAGSGLMHSETNPSPTEPVHFLQVWITPKERGGDPNYEQRSIHAQRGEGRLGLVISPDGRDGTMSIRQDALVFAGEFPNGGDVSHEVSAGRRAWLQVARGRVTVNGVSLDEGDGASSIGPGVLRMRFEPGAEALLFDLP